jgi:hypothetical protein
VKTAEEITAIYNDRVRDYGDRRARMRLLADLVNGDIVVPLPELSANEKPAIANLARQGIHQYAMRAASVLPEIETRPLRNTRAAHDNALTRRRVMYGWWEANRMHVQLRQRGRWLFAYADTPALILPCFGREIPEWKVENPLAVFPAPSARNELVPTDMIVAQVRSLAWLRWRYPDAARRVGMPGEKGDTRIEVLIYVDADEVSMVAARTTYADEYRDWWEVTADELAGRRGVLLEQAPNLAMRPLGVSPQSIAVDKQMGHFDGVIGAYHAAAELDAISRIAARQGVMQQEWLVSRPGEQAEVVRAADPLRGEVGIVAGGTLEHRSQDPQFATNLQVDRYIEAMRTDAGIPSELQGMAATNVRTGRRGSQLISAAVDFPVMEAQELLADSLTEENRIAVAVDKAWFRKVGKSYYVGWKGAKGPVEYVPEKLWSTDENKVGYVLAGSDLNSMVIAAGQRIGMGTLSQESFMRMDPLVDDVDEERAKIVRERLTAATLAQIEQMATTPGAGWEPVDTMRLLELVERGETLIDAFKTTQAEAQQRQAGPQGDPAAQPGVSPPGAGVEETGLIQGPTGDQDRLNQLLMRLRGPEMRVPAERGM